VLLPNEQEKITMEISSLIMFRNEIVAYCRVSISTVNRWESQGILPPRISSPHCKGRWLRSDIEQFMLSRVTPIPTITVTNPAKKQRQEEKAYRERQLKAEKALDQHRISRKQR